MSDAGDAKVGRRGHRLEGLLVAVEATVPHALRMALRKPGRSEQLRGKEGKSSQGGTCLG